MRPEASEDTSRASPPPQPSPVPSGAGKSPASSRGGNTSAGRAAPEPSDHRAEEDLVSPPEAQDTGASNIGVGSKDTGRAEPLVPPVPKKKTKTVPEPSAPATSPAPKETMDAPSSSPVTPTPPPAASTGGPASAKPTAPAQDPAAVVSAARSPSSGSRSLVLHAGRAALVAGETASAQLGRITELTRGGADLGHLADYAEKWNQADLSPATLGLGKDKLPVVDPAGPRSTGQHFGRLRRAVKEFDTAWHDANNNVAVSFTNLTTLQIYAGFYSFKIIYIFPVPEFRVESAVLSAKLS